MELRVSKILLISLACLLAGHMAMKAYFPSPIFWVFGFLIPFILLFWVLVIKRAEFSVILVIYVLNHFVYAENQGGLWCIVSFCVFLSYYIIFKLGHRSIFSGPGYLKWLFLVLILSNFVGLIIKNPMPLLTKAQGALTFFSYIMLYFFVSQQIITRKRLSQFFWITGFVSLYMLIVSINQKFAFVSLSTPLFPLVDNQMGYTSQHSHGTMGSSPLYAENSLMMLAIVFPFLQNKKFLLKLDIKQIWIAILFVILVINLLASNSRNTLLMFFAGIAIHFIIQSFNRKTLSLPLFIAAFVLLSVLAYFPTHVGLDTFINKLQLIDFKSITLAGIISGEDINRYNVFPFILDRLKENSWLIGYGYGTFDNNTLAWFGTLNTNIYDPHSMYMALPMTFGWIGAIAFLLIILSIYFNLVRSLLSDQSRFFPPYLKGAMVGLAVGWALILINEYKVNVLAKINYHAIFWLWLGLTSALVRTADICFREQVRIAKAKDTGVLRRSWQPGIPPAAIMDSRGRRGQGNNIITTQAGNQQKAALQRQDAGQSGQLKAPDS